MQCAGRLMRLLLSLTWIRFIEHMQKVIAIIRCTIDDRLKPLLIIYKLKDHLMFSLLTDFIGFNKVKRKQVIIDP